MGTDRTGPVDRGTSAHGANDVCPRDPSSGLVQLQLKGRHVDCKYRTLLAIDGGGMKGLIPGWLSRTQGLKETTTR